MGRGKIEIKKIENSTNRQVTFSKRRGGLLKKAQELSILCSAEVAVIIFSNTGKLCEYSNTSMTRILTRYQKEKGSQLWDTEHQHLYNEIKRLKEENEKLKSNLRHVKGDDINSLSVEELCLLEQALEMAADRVRTKKDQVFMEHLYNGRKRLSSLEEENKRLRQITGIRGPIIFENINGYGHVYRQGQESNPAPAFRVQPSHPNLKDTGY
uniref:TSA: Wollemia nobilis Ref_Wollemi_Transcript_23010_967 transcribed RNA sequence n=1 Tax=Wollemia nobilis TaxID=56998 RepID=A0A0C9QM97_9CONI